MMEQLKNGACIAVGVFFCGLAVVLLNLWQVHWYAFLAPLLLFAMGFLFMSLTIE
jgi:hypothetical protein